MRKKAFETKEEFNTLYGKYTVSEGVYNGRLSRVLFSEQNVPQSGLALDDEPDQLFFYCQRFMEVALSLRPSRVLVIGGGAFTVPTALVRQLGVRVDTVELNGGLVDIAKKHFDLASEDEGLNVFIDDGARFIAESHESYDLIILDAFVERSIPEDLISSDAFSNYSRLLGIDGALAINCISRYYTSSPTMLKELVSGLGKEFEFVAAYPADTTNDKRSDQNLIVIASNREECLGLGYVQSYNVL